MQSFTNWRLLIRDDGSIDNTQNIIERYTKSHPGKIVWLENDIVNVGTSQSFSILLYQSNAPYVALCDQDDVWCEEKLAIQMSKILEEESKCEKGYPLLINTDLKVTTDTLNIQSQSFWRYQNINPEKMSNLRNLFVQNHITGCTFLMNRALVNNILPIAKEAIVHDWWIALVVAAKGKIVTINTPTVLYRQHCKNDIGAKKWSIVFIIKKILTGSTMSRNSLNKTKAQTKALVNSGLIDGDNILLAKKYVSMFETNWLKRRQIMIQEKFFKYGFIRNLAMFIYM